jgi:hypothetical protein
MPRSWLAPSTTRDMTVGEAAWLAGFFDGEGSITSYMGGRDRQYRAWSLVIGNTHRGSIERCVEITGTGNLCEKVREQASFKRIWMWQVQSQRNILAVVQQMYPYLIVKKEKADELLEWFARRENVSKISAL